MQHKNPLGRFFGRRAPAFVKSNHASNYSNVSDGAQAPAGRAGPGAPSFRAVDAEAEFPPATGKNSPLVFRIESSRSLPSGKAAREK
jgi:hypothetical protein